MERRVTASLVVITAILVVMTLNGNRMRHRIQALEFEVVSIQEKMDRLIKSDLEFLDAANRVLKLWNAQ